MMPPLPSVSLKIELGVAELVAVGSVLAITFAALFNLGYFSLVNWSYLSLLSPQDLLTGALVAVPFAGGYVPMLINLFQDAASERKIITRASVLVIFLTLLVITIYYVTRNDPNQYVYLVGTAAFLTLGLFIVLRTFSRGSIYAVSIFISVGALLPYLFGSAMFAYDLARPEKHQTTLTLKDGTQLTAKILRLSTSYLFYLSDGSVVARRLEDVSQVSTKMD